jgi:hypothetical protein
MQDVETVTKIEMFVYRYEGSQGLKDFSGIVVCTRTQNSVRDTMIFAIHGVFLDSDRVLSQPAY